MPKTIMLVPVGHDVGLPTVRIGLQHAIASRGLRVTHFQPVTTPSGQGAITLSELEDHLSHDSMDEALDLMINAYEHQSQSSDVVLVHGLLAPQSSHYAQSFNATLCQALEASMVFVTAPGQHTPTALANQIEIVAKQYRRAGCDNILGCIINKIFAPTDEHGHPKLSIGTQTKAQPDLSTFAIQLTRVSLLAKISWQEALIAPRLRDITPHLGAKVIHAGDMQTRRVMNMSLCARNVEHMCSALKTGTLIITAGDRHDIILATAMAALNGTQLAGLLLTGGYPMDANIHALCQSAFQTGLPILSVESDSFTTCQRLQNITLHTPPDDVEKTERIERLLSEQLLGPWLEAWLKQDINLRMNQASFRYHLIQQASTEPRHIVLPEGDEPRILQAAIHCHEKGVAQITLLGSPEKIPTQAKHLGLSLPQGLHIVDPQSVCEQYIRDLVTLRAHKGMNAAMAREQLQDPIVLGTMMLQHGEVDGLVAGARTTTPNVLRPALQLIQTSPDAMVVSSVFFMCFPNQVLVFGDCAVNPHPSSEMLADIAIQSANTANHFGIEAKVAMISYSTGSSAGGEEVTRVREATKRVAQLSPKLLVDGPLQYDAAIIPGVAEQKAPHSPLHGEATVLIFPDLNTGNTTYKAVQRSANLLCIGPVLQGLNKPVNDLSRGASVEDIIYTIALTVRQAQSS